MGDGVCREVYVRGCVVVVVSWVECVRGLRRACLRGSVFASREESSGGEERAHKREEAVRFCLVFLTFVVHVIRPIDRVFLFLLLASLYVQARREK
jgi:hypothetical protein